MFDMLKKKLSNVVGSFVNKKDEEIKRNLEEETENDYINNDEELRENQNEPIDKVETNEKEVVDENQKIKQIEEQRVKKKIKDEQKTEDKELINLSIKTRIKGALLRNVKISQSDIDKLKDTLTISMLQSDVAQETTEKFTSDLSKRLADTKFSYNNMKEKIMDDIRASLLDILNKTNNGIDIIEYVKNRLTIEKPVRIVFLGPNGTGKTTTIAKIAYMLKKNNITSVMSASDTFRAAAIEQTEYHAIKVGVPVIKSSYGADPASVAYDAIGYARSHHIDVVLIDTAGRQETNKNLIIEVQKMVRISKPDLTIFVGESISGNVIAMQIFEFNKFVKIDGIILTKLDCDVKGGNVISIADITGIPILLFGTGEDYNAIIKYDPNFIVNSILPKESIVTN